MTAQLGQADRARIARSGILPITPEQGLQLFDVGLHTDRAVLVPVRLDPSALRDPAPLLRGLVRTPARRLANDTAAPAALADRLAGLPPEARTEILHELVRGQVAEVLGHPSPNTLDSQRGLLDLGMDSLTALELRNRLGAAVGRRLPTTLIFDHPTIAALAGHLDAEVIPAPVSGLGELDRLEELLLTLPADGDRRILLTRRLQEMLAKAGIQTGGTAQLLESASDDELFDFIDNELDVS
jgi:aryl carrier-like protein